MSYSYLEVERRENGVAIITLNNPENLNALGVEISQELKDALLEAEADGSIRVIVLRGAGRAFSSGGNLKEMRENLARDPGQYMDELTSVVYAAVDTVMDINKPVIASVHGFAFGAAFNLVVACDMAIAASDTVFCESFINLGLIPGGRATTLLPRILGIRRAAELCMTGREVSAEEALSLGLVNRVVAPEELSEATMKMADRLAAGPPLALEETKRLLRTSQELSPREQSVEERKTQIKMALGNDFKEGVTSFFEKRKPRFGRE